MKENELKTALAKAWCAETSASPNAWMPENPALGQCAVSALVVQDHFGGDLLRSKVGGVSHYWNRLPDGREIDWTLRQFKPRGPIFLDEDPQLRTREYVLSFPDTVKRYELLKARMKA